MTNVVSFVPRHAARQAIIAGDTIPASIIIFPGVRYERAHSRPVAASGMKKPSGKPGGSAVKPVST